MSSTNKKDLEKISVVVCAKNAGKTIRRCLHSVSRTNVKEIIVVDGCSEDNTIQIAKKYTNKIYSDEGKGLGFARQLGAEKAQGEYVAYIDSDTELPSENVLSKMLEELEKNGWVAIHAQLVDPRSNKTYWEEGEDFHWRNRFNIPGERRYLGTIVCLIRRDIILKYKFDPFFKGAAEDSDFYHRVGKNGYKFGVSSAVAYHYHRATFKDFIKQRIWYGKGNAIAIIKHRAWILLIAPFLILGGGVLLSLHHRKIRYIPFYLVWSFSLMLGTIIGFLEILSEKLSRNQQVHP